MSWNYEEYLKRQIHNAVVDTGIKDADGNDYVFEVCTEQIFVGKQTLSPTTIYVVIKYLSSTNTLNAVEQPVQILIFCEDNQIQASQIIFSKFVSSNNFKEMFEDGTYIKQDYREPVVLSNFNQTGYGYRTIMYISGTLFLMENVIDVSNLNITVDGRYELSVDMLTEDEQRQMRDCFSQGNLTQNASPEYIIKSSALHDALVLLQDFDTAYMICKDASNNGLLKVNDILCTNIEISIYSVVLYNNGINVGQYFFSQYDGDFRIQFLPRVVGESTFVEGFTEQGLYLAVLVDRVIFGINQTETVKPVNFNIAYSMTPNTQPIPPAKIATSVKSLATLGITFSVPLVSSYKFVQAISQIMTGILSGNLTFIVSFDLGNVHFNANMKLVSTQITTAINQIPGLQIGMMM